VRVWQLPPDALLSGGLGTLPLALISDVTEAQLPGILKHIERRLSSRQARKQAQTVWASAYILLGLRYSAAPAEQLFRGIVSMEESSTYQKILEEGREEGLEEGVELGEFKESKKLLRHLGEKAFGAPSPSTTRVIDQLNDLKSIEEALERIRTANSWDELLEPNPPPRRGRRRSE
jgi:predicted transposase YdaD